MRRSELESFFESRFHSIRQEARHLACDLLRQFTSSRHAVTTCTIGCRCVVCACTAHSTSLFTSAAQQSPSAIVILNLIARSRVKPNRLSLLELSQYPLERSGIKTPGTHCPGNICPGNMQRCGAKMSPPKIHANAVSI
jgi:hypothetical protein